MLSEHDLPDGLEEYIDNAYCFLHRAGNFQFSFHDVAMFLSLMGIKPDDFKPVIPPPKKVVVRPPVDWAKVDPGAKIVTDAGKYGEFESLESSSVAVVTVGHKSQRVNLETIELQE